jgi:outer membrane receptor protein involved in Fe transport
MPINERLALRVSGYDRDDPGYVDDVLTGEDNVNDFRVYGGRASLLWLVNDGWKVRLSALYNYQKGSGPIVQYDPFTFRPAYGDLKNAFAVGTNVNEQKLAAYNLEIEGRLGGFATLTSSTGYDRQTMNMGVDYTELVGPLIQAFFGIPGVGASIDDRPVGVDKFVQEVRLASPADARLAWQVGGFYTHEHTNVLSDLPLFDAVSGAPVTGLPNFFTGESDTRFEEVAGFGDVTYHLTPAFDITGGVRYSHNNQHFVTTADGVINGGHSFADVKSDDSSVTWLVNPRYHIAEDTMVYARIATGYRPGAPNTGVAGTPLTYGPDKVTNYEVGLKSDLFDRRVSIEGSLYWIDWKDIQLQEVSPAGISYIANGGSAVSRGFDLTGEWRPLAGLQLYANAAWQDTYLTRAFPAGGQVGAKGDPLPLTPKWSGALGGAYSFPLSARWSGQLGADWRLVGKTLGAFPNPGFPRFEHPAYDVLDLRAGVSNDRWTLMVYARNVGDSRGQTADLNIGLTRVTLIQPRTYALSLSTTF